MLGQTSQALAEDSSTSFQVGPDGAATSRDFGAWQPSRLLWAGLGLACLMIIGLSALMAFPAVPHGDEASLMSTTAFAYSKLNGVKPLAKVHEAKTSAPAFVPFLAPPLKAAVGRTSTEATIIRMAPAIDKNLFLETSQKDEEWLGRFQTMPLEASKSEDEADKTPQLSMDPKKPPEGPEPFSYVQGDVISLSSELSDLVKTESPVLKMAATQLFSKHQQGKGFRPTLVTLVSLACSGTSPEEHRASQTYSLQTKLAQITEMIHVASLIHDDVLDESPTRRGQLAVHQTVGNKVAILAGDYLLATASQLLANLGDNEVVRIMASALKSLVEGEIMQAQAAPEDYLDMTLYLRKSYYKTGSLITLAANSAAVLGGHDAKSDVAKAAETYGYHLGLAYQIVDDVLDFTANTDILGKPVGVDMKLGLATAPVLYAMERDDSLKPLIMRRFKGKGDIKKAFDAVHSDKGWALHKAKQLARWHAQAAVDAAYELPPSDAREALVRMAHMVLTRPK